MNDSAFTPRRGWKTSSSPFERNRIEAERYKAARRNSQKSMNNYLNSQQRKEKRFLTKQVEELFAKYPEVIVGHVPIRHIKQTVMFDDTLPVGYYYSPYVPIYTTSSKSGEF